MPTFTQEVEVHIDVEEFIDSCSQYNKDWLIKLLIEDGLIKSDSRINESSKQYNYSIAEADFEQALDKLKGKYNMLTSEEEQIVIKLASRF